MKQDDTDTNLAQMPVIIFDCQATGADYHKHYLLEMGWAILPNGIGSNEIEVKTAILQPPSEISLPQHVLRITGLSSEELSCGMTLESAWKMFYEPYTNVTLPKSSKKVPLIIHFARFETSYVENLYQRFAADNGELPFEIICTHEIVKRLIPGLPRKGLRAVAGYFGYSTNQCRRSLDHVKATAAIWSALVKRLQEELNITTLAQLLVWLSEPPVSKPRIRSYPMNKALLKQIPDSPGIYVMRRSNHDVLYVGKATSLRQRVNSYFRKKSTHAGHILEMLSQACDIQYSRTESALEAALLEADTIKQFSPPYNKALQCNRREPVFFTRLFDACNSKRSQRYPVGPIVTTAPFHVLHLLDMHISRISAQRTVNEQEYDEIMGSPNVYTPQRSCFLDGFELFAKLYPTVTTSPNTISNLLCIGIQQWRKQLEICLQETGDDDESAAGQEEILDDKTKEITWTPQRVVPYLESCLCRAAHLLRQARWFTLLSESIIVWKCKKSPDTHLHCMIIGRGKVKHYERNDDIDISISLRGLRKRFKARQNCFDIATYDRMRVLTTELRRLVKDNRLVMLRITPSAIMHSSTMARLLQWV